MSKDDRKKELKENLKKAEKKQAEVKKDAKAAKGKCVTKGVRFPRDKFFKGECSFSESKEKVVVFGESVNKDKVKTPERIDLTKRDFERLFTVKEAKAPKSE